MADPFDVSVTFTGLNRVRNQLRAAASFYKQEADPLIGKHAKSESARMRDKAYPPRLPNQKYIRTYELKRKYRAQHKGAGVWAVINRRKGAVWVIKKGMQNRKYHAGRWYTLEDELNKNVPKLTKNLSAHLEQLLNSQRD